MEARAGIEQRIEVLQTSALPLGYRATEKTPAQGEGWKLWSGRRDLNPRLRPWQGRTLPLSYSRSASKIIPQAPIRSLPPPHCGYRTSIGRIYVSSSSIFFAALSSLAIRKLRICPARAGSGLEGPPPPVFQRVCNIELSEERSAFVSFGASFTGAAAFILQVAKIPSPSSTL